MHQFYHAHANVQLKTSSHSSKAEIELGEKVSYRHITHTILLVTISTLPQAEMFILEK